MGGERARNAAANNTAANYADVPEPSTTGDCLQPDDPSVPRLVEHERPVERELPVARVRRFGCGWQRRPRLAGWDLLAWRWQREFSGTAAQVRAARMFAEDLLADCPARDDAGLIVAELAANAIQWSRSGDLGGVFVLQVTRNRRWVQVAITDQGSAGEPITLEVELDALDGLTEHGRGLACVEAVADSAGSYRTVRGARVVWARLRFTPSTRMPKTG